MKKIFPILLLAMTLGLFSSCVIVAEVPTYKVYFNNDTALYVYDWYIKNYDGDNYCPDDEYCEIPPYRYDYVSGVPEDGYQFYFCLFSTRRKDYYFYTDTFYKINETTTFYLSSKGAYIGKPRSAIGPDEIEDNPENLENLILKDSEGNEYPLELLVIEK